MHSSAAVARRRQRAIRRGYICATPQGFSHVLIERSIVDRVRETARSLMLHRRHGMAAGHMAHYARDATRLAAERGCITQPECSRALRQHRLANRAKHDWQASVGAPDHVAGAADLANLVASMHNVAIQTEVTDAAESGVQVGAAMHSVAIMASAAALDVSFQPDALPQVACDNASDVHTAVPFPSSPFPFPPHQIADDEVDSSYSRGPVGAAKHDESNRSNCGGKGDIAVGVEGTVGREAKSGRSGDVPQLDAVACFAAPSGQHDFVGHSPPDAAPLLEALVHRVADALASSRQQSPAGCLGGAPQQATSACDAAVAGVASAVELAAIAGAHFDAAVLATVAGDVTPRRCARREHHRLTPDKLPLDTGPEPFLPIAESACRDMAMSDDVQLHVDGLQEWIDSSRINEKCADFLKHQAVEVQNIVIRKGGRVANARNPSAAMGMLRHLIQKAKAEMAAAGNEVQPMRQPKDNETALEMTAAAEDVDGVPPVVQQSRSKTSGAAQRQKRKAAAEQRGDSRTPRRKRHPKAC